MNPNIIALAVPCADDAFRSDIELYCNHVSTDHPPDRPGPRHWYDTRPDAIDRCCPEEDIAKAVAYLDMRGMLQRHPTAPHIVTFKRSE